MKSEKLFKNKFLFVLFAMITTALWGTAFPGVKLGYDWFGIDSSDTGSKLLFAGVRFMLAGATILLIYSVKNKRLPKFTKAQAKPIILLSLIQITGNYFFYYIGLSHTAGSVASVLNSFDTFCTVILVSLFFKNDKADFKKALGCVIGLAGIALANSGNIGALSFSVTGEGFILISALFSSFGIIINKKAAMQASPMIVTGYHLLIGGAVLTSMAVPLDGRLSFANPKASLCLLYLSFVSAAAFFIWSQLLKHNDVSKVSVFKLMTPIFGNVFSALALGEDIFDPMHIMSVALVAAGIVTVNIKTKPPKSGGID